MLKFGSDTKALEVQSSSDEESKAVVPFKIPEVQADSHAHVNMLIYSQMPGISKRGFMNTDKYFLIITELRELQHKGDFVGHEELVKEQMMKLKTEADSDFEMSLQIERAMVLYFENKIKDAKKILKNVVKQENQLKNPGILVGRALNLLTAVYKRQGKFGKAMECWERANTCLEGYDSAYDKAELYHSYGALIMAMPAAKEPATVQATKEEAYKSYQMAVRHKHRKYVIVKMAALLLESRFRGERTAHFPPCGEDVTKAKNHLDFVESNLGKNESLGTSIKLLLLRSDQYRYEHDVAKAMEKAQEADMLIHQHGFELEDVPAKRRIDHLSAMLRQENEERQEKEFSSTLSTSDYLVESESAHSD